MIKLQSCLFVHFGRVFVSIGVSLHYFTENVLLYCTMYAHTTPIVPYKLVKSNVAGR